MEQGGDARPTQIRLLGHQRHAAGRHAAARSGCTITAPARVSRSSAGIAPVVEQAHVLRPGESATAPPRAASPAAPAEPSAAAARPPPRRRWRGGRDRVRAKNRASPTGSPPLTSSWQAARRPAGLAVGAGGTAAAAVAALAAGDAGVVVFCIARNLAAGIPSGGICTAGRTLLSCVGDLLGDVERVDVERDLRPVQHQVHAPALGHLPDHRDQRALDLPQAPTAPLPG